MESNHRPRSNKNNPRSSQIAEKIQLNIPQGEETIDKAENQKVQRETKEGQRKIPGVTISKDARKFLMVPKFETPSPLSYEIQNVQSKLSVSFTKSIGHSTGKEKKNSTGIGPGEYEAIKDLSPHRQNEFTFGTKYEGSFDVSKEGPGPGHYDFLPKIEKEVKYALNKGFGTSSRFPNSTFHCPGPASYKMPSLLNKSINEKTTLSTAERSSNEKENRPGPGLYNSPSFLDNSKKKGVTISKQRNQFEENHYTKNAFLNYEIKRDFDVLRSPAYSIGEEKRSSPDDRNTPSPQHYSIKMQYPNSPIAHISKGKGVKEPRPEDGPGPAIYHKEQEKSPIKYSIPKSKSNSLLMTGSDSPGVGRYNQVLLSLSKSSLFSKSKRMETAGNEYSAGVGNYNISDTSSKYCFSIPRAGLKEIKEN